MVWTAQGKQWTTHVRGEELRASLYQCADPACGVHHVELIYENGRKVILDEFLGPTVRATPEERDLVRVLLEQNGLLAAQKQAEEEHLASVRLPAKALKPGQPNIWFSRLLRPGPSWCLGGTNHVDGFAHGGHTWLVDESYCPRPGCDCRDARIAFIDVDDRPEGEEESRGFDVMGPLEGPWQVVKRYGSLAAPEAARVWAAYQEVRPALAERIEHHYGIVKEVGARRPAGKVRRKKVSRNGPCPCGSGRRYKACCGVGA